MTIWTWATEAYARPAARAACLGLQDEHGQCVSLLLWAAYSGVGDADVMRRGAELAHGWEASVLRPLRETRRQLKVARPPVEDVARLQLREQVAAAELAGERVLLEALESISGARGDVATPVALLAASRAWGDDVPTQALASLARALR